MKDPYTYDDGLTLKNKFDIKNFKKLSDLENIVVDEKRCNTPSGEFDYKHLKSIHKHLFGDLYEWAGQERS